MLDFTELSREEIIFLSAECDEALIKALEKDGVSSDSTKLFVQNLRSKIQSGELDCGGVKPAIKKRFKNKPKVKKIALNYRRKVMEWLNGPSKYIKPPQFDLQNLPPLTSQTLNRYLEFFEKKFRDFANYYEPKHKDDTTIDKEFMKELPPSVQFGLFSMHNCGNIIKRFIKEGEENALQVLIHIFDINDPFLMQTYEGLIRKTIQELSNNIHFLRSLFNLLDENFHKKNMAKKVDTIIMKIIVSELTQLDICNTFSDDEEGIIDNTKPRTEQRHTLGFIVHWKDGVEKDEINLRIPHHLMPIHWNGCRLVNPKLNQTFQKFADALDEIKCDEKMQKEGAKYYEDLLTERKYAVDFARIKATDIPGMEEDDLWFHFFHNDQLSDGEIGVEVIVNGASVVYFLNQELDLRVHHQGNMIPLLENYDDVPDDHIDSIYANPNVSNWLSKKAIKNLHFYIFKYAHHLLVSPRTTKEGDNVNDNESPKNNKFNIRLSEYSSEITIPYLSQGYGSSHKHQSKLTVYHGVTGHVRELPKGWKPSQESIEEASKHNIFLAPGQTFVKHHHRGSELAEETVSRKKIEN